MNFRMLGPVLFTVGLANCSTIKPKPLDEHVNVGRLISALDQEVRADQNSVANLLAPDELKVAESRVRDARLAHQRAEQRDRLLKLTGLAEAHVERVRALIVERQPGAADVLRERDQAVTAGALKFNSTRAHFEELDQMFRERYPKSESRRVRLLNGYRDVEVAAVQQRVLGPTRHRVATAERIDARRIAPASLTTARRALAAAEDAVRRSPRRVDGYRDEVILAQNLSRALVAISAESRVVANRSDEELARELLKQKQEVEQLKSELAGIEVTKSVTEQKLRDASEENQFLTALEQARQDLGEDEANVYRAGDRLLIRLKSDPTAASTLSKVKGVIRKLNGRDVIVQGGTPRRAEAVTESLNEVTRVGRLVGPDSPAVEILVRPELVRR